MKISIFLSLVLFLAQINTAFAGLVQCEVSETSALCNLCQLLATVQAVINFLIGLAFLGAVILIAVAGFNMFYTGGNPEKVKKALKSIQSVVVGILIVLCAWAIVNTIIWFLAKPGSPPTFWNQINC
jgi:type IV secretory pathway VirB2 component (pilin)